MPEQLFVPRVRRPLGLALLCLVWVSGMVLTAPAAWAHPLGNFTVNTHLGVRVEPAAVALDAVVDIAEIPTLQAFPDLRADSGGTGTGVAAADQRAYRERICPALRDAVKLELDGKALELAVISSSLSFPPGEAGLPTARLECSLRTTQELDTVGHELVVTDSMAVQPVGWREITAVGDGVELAASNVPERSVSGVLRDYPEDLLDDPLDQRTATLSIAKGSGVITGAGTDGGESATSSLRGLDPLTAAFTDLVAATRLSVGFGIFAATLAVLLGAMHAFAPGHGKALMAAYLMDRNGTLRQAALIGVSVTLTHTVGVLALGVLLSVAVVTAPERIYPWLSLAGGLLLAGIGFSLLRRAGRPGPGHGHGHGPGHGHGAGHGHGHGGLAGALALPGGMGSAEVAPARAAIGTLTSPDESRHDPGIHSETPRTHPQDTRTRGRVHRSTSDARSMLAVGFVGGLVPSPSALVVLLGGIALGRAWFGVLLVLAYGIGMALALVGTGLLFVRGRDQIERRFANRGLEGRWTRRVLALSRRLPTITAGLVVVIGLGLALQALPRL